MPSATMISGATVSDADDAQAALFEQGGNSGKQPVIAAAKHSDDSRHEPQHLPIGSDLRERRPQQRPDEHRLAAPFRAGEAKEAARLSDRDPMMGIALDHLRVRPAAHGNMTGRRPRRLTASATAPGKLPPPQMIASGSPLTAAAASAPGASDTIGFAVPGRPCGGRMHQRPLAACADESDHLLHQGSSANAAATLSILSANTPSPEKARDRPAAADAVRRARCRAGAGRRH